MDMLTDVWTTRDPRAFLDRAAAYLTAEPVLTNVLSVVAESLDRGGYAFDDPWFAVVGSSADGEENTDGGQVVCAAMRTAPFAYVGPGPDAAGGLVAAALLASGRRPTGVVGARRPAGAFAAAWSAGTGGSARVATDEGVHVLRALTPPDGVPGRARTAATADVPLLEQWLTDFRAEALGHLEPERREDLVTGIRSGVQDRRYLLWEVDAVPVSLAGIRRPAHGVGRVGPVWTPPGHRRRGFAAMVTTAACRALIDGGAEQVMLFTDLANRTSNGVYARLGFERVGEAVEYVFG